ncbi:MAG: hypothetical protein JWN67_4636 [Actinomycetia bacterium]|nr:hypothetical protein [Actinomycetes bacterium]
MPDASHPTQGVTIRSRCAWLLGWSLVLLAVHFLSLAWDGSGGDFGPWSKGDVIHQLGLVALGVGASLLPAAVLAWVLLQAQAADAARAVANQTVAATFRGPLGETVTSLLEQVRHAETYIHQSTWTFVFEQATKDTVDVMVTAVTTEEVLARHGYRPTTSFRVVPSVPRHASAVQTWHVTSTSPTVYEVLAEDGLVPAAYRWEGDPYTAILPDAFPRGSIYVATKRGAFRLATSDGFPMFLSVSQAVTTVRVVGDAAANLTFALWQVQSAPPYVGASPVVVGHDVPLAAGFPGIYMLIWWPRGQEPAWAPRADTI